MSGEDRRRTIVELLQKADAPLKGSELARQCGVSRQVIVQDIALIKRDGHQVISTNRGYLMSREQTRPRRLLKVRHDPDRVEEEMTLVVDLGGTLEDILVNHRTYGKMSARLDVSSRSDVKRFLEDMKTSKSRPLSEITSGYHFHNVSARDEETLDRIEEDLDKEGFLAELTPWEAQSLR